jgi:hypothetical protein
VKIEGGRERAKTSTIDPCDVAMLVCNLTVRLSGEQFALWWMAASPSWATSVYVLSTSACSVVSERKDGQVYMNPCVAFKVIPRS